MSGGVRLAEGDRPRLLHAGGDMGGKRLDIA